MHKIDSAGATIDNKFTVGNPGTGTPATVLDADWLNAVQEEMISVLAAGSVTPAKGTWTQLRDAMQYLIDIRTATLQNKTLSAPVISGNASGNGMVPVGGIIPIGNVAAWALPAAGAVKDGYALCNGQTFTSLGAGNFNASFSGSLPTLNDSRFLMGSTAPSNGGGAIAQGQNSITLTTANMPSHAHTLPSHSHSLPSHDHSINHDHAPFGTTDGAGAHSHVYDRVLGAGSGMYGATSQVSMQYPSTSTAGAHNHTIDVPYYSGTSGAWSGTSGVWNGNSGSEGSATAIENRPLYFSVVYLMRVQ
jgi:hypothetical protein